MQPKAVLTYAASGESDIGVRPIKIKGESRPTLRSVKPRAFAVRSFPPAFRAPVIE
jgi:hypothetical protein